MITRCVRTSNLHRAVVHGDTVYLSGMVADDKSLDAGGQTQQILENLAVLLESVNSDASQLLSATIYLTHMHDKEAMNAAWSRFFAPEDMPARATVAVAELGPRVLVEVVATAAAARRV